MRLVHRVAQLALLHHHAHCHPVLLVQVRNRWRHSPFADLQHLLERVFVDVVAAQHEPARCKHPQNSVRDLGHQLPMLPLPPASSPRSRQDQRSRPPDLARTPPPRSLTAAPNSGNSSLSAFPAAPQDHCTAQQALAPAACTAQTLALPPPSPLPRPRPNSPPLYRAPLSPNPLCPCSRTSLYPTPEETPAPPSCSSTTPGSSRKDAPSSEPQV
ncbi:hypothetical protein AYI70_g10623 [Smittium culicis]|uniref:Uncharacterized protein n=1 Tax=Smittium culicis TaxID=133412 RepID=A0A1R1X5N5_9FUNG|nr:hypothetical protein AYI70_g10623 [Smittium culicis]